MDMMAGIAQGGAGQRGEMINLPSTELKKRKDVAQADTFNSPSAMLDMQSRKKTRTEDSCLDGDISPLLPSSKCPVPELDTHVEIPASTVEFIPPAVKKAIPPVVSITSHQAASVGISQAVSHPSDPSSYLSPAVQALAGPSREEWNNHRLNALEMNFLQSQRTALVEAKLGRANFDLSLPSIPDYYKLPVEHSRAALVPITVSPQYQYRPALQASQDGVCHCGLPLLLQTVKAPGAELGRQFFSCAQKKESDQCSYFNWVKNASEKPALTERPKLVDLYCNCGLVSLVKSVQKNGR